MGKTIDEMKIGETTAGLIRAYDLAKESLNVVLEAFVRMYGDTDADSRLASDVQPQYDAYVDAIFKAVQTSVMQSRAFCGEDEI